MQQNDDEPRDEGIEHAPAPSEEEIERAKSPAGGWTRATLARWGVPWPPTKGWRRDLIAKHRAGMGVTPIRAEAAPAQPEPTRTAEFRWERDIGTVDPEDPPPWV